VRSLSIDPVAVRVQTFRIRRIPLRLPNAGVLAPVFRSAVQVDPALLTKTGLAVTRDAQRLCVRKGTDVSAGPTVVRIRRVIDVRPTDTVPAVWVALRSERETLGVEGLKTREIGRAVSVLGTTIQAHRLSIHLGTQGTRNTAILIGPGVEARLGAAHLLKRHAQKRDRTKLRLVFADVSIGTLLLAVLSAKARLALLFLKAELGQAIEGLLARPTEAPFQGGLLAPSVVGLRRPVRR